MLNGFLLLAATAGALQQSPVVHYRVTLNSTRSVDPAPGSEAGIGGAYSAVAFVSASTTTENGNRMAHVVIDSVSCQGSGLMSMAFDTIVGQKSRGARYDFAIGSRLEVIPRPTIDNPLTNVLAQVALMLFPTIAPNPVAGTTWTDSLDTTMGEQSDRNHPVVTRWKLAKVVGDTTVADGEVRGAVTSNGRTVGTGLITGTRHMTAVAGLLKMQTSTVSLETQMVAAEGATRVTRGTGITSLEIVAFGGPRAVP